MSISLNFEQLRSWVGLGPSPAELERRLQPWVQAAGYGEMRREAAKNIVEAYAESRSELNLENLNLDSLPSEISLLTSLATLKIAHNHLKSLVLESKSLKYIDAEYNHLDFVHIRLLKCPNLRIFLAHNLFSGIYTSLLNETVEDLKKQRIGHAILHFH